MISSAAVSLTRDRLEEIYLKWNKPEYISPDPLETLDPYTDGADREAAALLAASMAYGRVNALLPPLKKILKLIGRSPRDYLQSRSEDCIAADLTGIVHRFAQPEHFAALLAGAGAVIRRFGSLEESFRLAYQEAKGDVQSGLSSLVAALRGGCSGEPGYLLARPWRGSACKRLNLFLRWMVRRDEVDPGGWTSVACSDLLLPLDTWTYRIALMAGWTRRRTMNLVTVREVSEALKELNPEDPVKYDFALSRYGIRGDLHLDNLFLPG